jgi:4-carboxymuconolactone decarboxylase
VTGDKVRVPLVERDEMEEAGLPIYDRVSGARGHMGNIFKALANSASALDKVAAVGEFVRFQADFDPALREAVILTVARELSCTYEYTHHYPLAAKAGIDPDVLPRIATPEGESQPAPLGPALRYARLVANNQPVPDDLFEELRGLFGNAMLTDLTVMIGYYGLLGRVINTFQVQVEEGTETVRPPALENAT